MTIAAPKLARVQPFARAALVVGLLVLGIWTVHTFLPALIWAVILAIAIWPAYERLAPDSRPSALVPAVLTGAVCLLFVLPLMVAIIQAAREAHDLLGWFREADAAGISPPDWLTQLPWGAEQARTWWAENLSHPMAGSELLSRLHEGSTVAASRQLGAAVVHRLVLFTFSLLTLFFLLRYGRELNAKLRIGSERLFGRRGEKIGLQMIASVHGTLSGLVLVGLGEGFALGVAYWIAGVPHPVLLGALTGIAAMIPFGAPLVFLIAAALLVGNGGVTAAIAIAAFGFVVLAVADHVIRPVLIGGATQLPFVWVLLGILGGVETWGLLGLFLGPAIMASLMLLWRELTSPSKTVGARKLVGPTHN